MIDEIHAVLLYNRMCPTFYMLNILYIERSINPRFQAGGP